MQRCLRKIVLVIIDGLRPDAITQETMPLLTDAMSRGWRPLSATTVRPSVTVAALSSLATGVAPATHGLIESRLRSLPRLRGLRPIPWLLRRLGIPTTVFAPALTGSSRWIAGALLRLAGAGRLRPVPHARQELGDHLTRHLGQDGQREFVVLYLNDADLAGHGWGWMSPAYLAAAAAIDRGLGFLDRASGEPDVLTIVTADHGGGGVLPTDHDEPHPVNDEIPLCLLGGRVAAGETGLEPATLLDVPPTVLYGFGVRQPREYAGRVLHEAFEPEPALAGAGVAWAAGG